MGKVGAIVLFSVIRIAVFVIPLVVLLLLNADPWLSAILAAIFGFSFSILVLDRLKAPLLQTVYDRRKPVEEKIDEDSEFEDQLIDQAGLEEEPKSE